MTETTIIETNSAEETISAAEQFAKLLKAGDTVLYTGEMGAGKTQFTKGIAKHFGCTDPVTSPTFAIVNEYRCEPPLMQHLVHDCRQNRLLRLFLFPH